MADSISSITKATLAVYAVSAKEAWRGFAKNWRLPLLHVVLIVPLSFLFKNSAFSFMFGGWAGGLIIGMVFAFVLAGYLATVRAAATNEHLLLDEIWSETIGLFSPLISVLFLIFLASFVLGMVFPPAVVLLNIAIAIVLNPAPEGIIHGRGCSSCGGLGTEIVVDCFDFVRENFFEWFIPWVVLLLLLFAPIFGTSMVFGMLLSVSPISLVQSVFSFLSIDNLLHPVSLVLIIAFLYALYFVFVFRAVLYLKLASSTRRKRVYQYEAGELK